MPAPELRSLPSRRVVATPEALDAARWSGGSTVLRLAPDEALGVGATAVAVDDPAAIDLPEAGFVGAWLSADELAALVVPHLEWPLPAARPALAQGKVAGVPAKLWLAPAGDARGAALLVTHAALAHELADRLGLAR
ncbi:MAG: hypothetical protein RL338_1420 [Chloroflexota bacterium]